jgi:glyoxylase-like metal-dependent hydrolase (beta-lactamase superfamily II)
MPSTVYQLLILQDGELPLLPNGNVSRFREHRCTATLVWPAGSKPTPANSVVVDPCFTSRGWQSAVRRLAALGISPAQFGYYFMTHRHLDHALVVPEGVDRPDWQPWRPRLGGGLFGLSAVACPGHAPELQALKFACESGEVWVVGDAILNQDWLVNWSYYWPNGYEVEEILQTWRSVAAILARAQQVIPGHGPAIQVTAELLDRMLAGFQHAPYASDCPEVAQALRFRRDSLAAGTT